MQENVDFFPVFFFFLFIFFFCERRSRLFRRGRFKQKLADKIIYYLEHFKRKHMQISWNNGKRVGRYENHYLKCQSQQMFKTPFGETVSTLQEQSDLGLRCLSQSLH